MGGSFLLWASNYDQAGAWIIASGAGSVTAVAERLKPEAVYRRA